MTRHDDAIESAARQWCEFDWNDPEEVSPDEKRQWIAEAREVVDYYLAHMRPEVASVEELRNGAAFIDSAGDIGVVTAGRIHYPETSPLDPRYVSKKYGPFRVLHWGDA